MIRIQGPKGPVELRIRAFRNGQRTEPRTKDREIAEAIEKLDVAGVGTGCATPPYGKRPSCSARTSSLPWC